MRLIRDNVERIAETKEQEALLIRQGFRPLSEEAAEDAELDAAAPVAEVAAEMTVKELRALAKSKGIKGASSLTKEELLAALEG